MIKKVSHIALSLVLMVSTMGMTINMHYCGQQLIDFGLFSEAESCCMTEESSTTTSPDHHCAVDIPQDNKCQDETLQVEPVDAYVGTTAGFSIESLQIIKLFLGHVAVATFVNESENTSIEFPDWSISPPTTSRFLSIIQTYLI